ncbi:type II toxin-antitoxin system RelE/ParE family toxin [Spirulina major CS-329]|jgi:mRNA interferase RelE/StbE|uniref:type II toxin-antitoxin system RelE family toxin n=1 Tax=Spirulina TaxID=1154 RepID=UPI00232E5297|nr:MULTISPECIES: type II toxin-antitoxin system RelE/ParE family toxin [Spirulina]MDB9493759.1 type II toxin-antitoxin system RelE/ParE family toxin [Spirulina subsalsa CS-330]MDB9501622.1 type II toxin-antitoxin system RelE/ParE family toxin [Spirulina major CS-329]
MEIEFHKNAVKALKKLSPKDTQKIRTKLLTLLNSLEETGVVASGELDIKALEGNWQGFFRMRVGKLRVIFRIDAEQEILYIYNLGSRGNIYKN